MKVKLFMENMWKFLLVFYFVPYKVNIPMHAGEFFMFFLFPTKLIFPCMQGDLNKSYIRNVFVGYKWKFTFQTKPLWGFATVWSPFLTDNLFSTLSLSSHPFSQPYTVEVNSILTFKSTEPTSTRNIQYLLFSCKELTPDSHVKLFLWYCDKT
jgi:hypothetical protein